MSAIYVTTVDIWSNTYGIGERKRLAREYPVIRLYADQETYEDDGLCDRCEIVLVSGFNDLRNALALELNVYIVYDEIQPDFIIVDTGKALYKYRRDFWANLEVMPHIIQEGGNEFHVWHGDVAGSDFEDIVRSMYRPRGSCITS